MIYSHSRATMSRDRFAHYKQWGKLFLRWFFVLAILGVLSIPASCWFHAPVRSEPPLLQEVDDALDLVASTDWAPDPDTILVTTSSQRLLFIVRNSGRSRHPFQVPVEGVSSAAISPDGKMVIVGYYDGSVAFEDLRSNTGPVRKPAVHAGSVVEVACTTNGCSLASACTEGSLCVWQASGGKSWQLTGIAPRINALALSPDGRTLATGNMAGTIRLFDLESRRECLSIETRYGIVQRLVFTSDGTRLYALGMDLQISSIGCWELPSGKPVWKPALGEPGVVAFDISSDGKSVASGGFQKEVIVQNAETGEVTNRIPWIGVIRSLQFSPSGKSLLLTTESLKALHLYDLELSGVVQVIPIGEGSLLQEALAAIAQFGLRLAASKRNDPPESSCSSLGSGPWTTPLLQHQAPHRNRPRLSPRGRTTRRLLGPQKRRRPRLDHHLARVQ